GPRQGQGCAPGGSARPRRGPRPDRAGGRRELAARRRRRGPPLRGGGAGGGEPRSQRVAALDHDIAHPGDARGEGGMSTDDRSIEDTVTSADFGVTLEHLRREIEARRLAEEQLQKALAERADMEQEMRGMLDLIHQQESAIRAMATPILRVW